MCLLGIDNASWNEIEVDDGDHVWMIDILSDICSLYKSFAPHQKNINLLKMKFDIFHICLMMDIISFEHLTYGGPFRPEISISL